MVGNPCVDGPGGLGLAWVGVISAALNVGNPPIVAPGVPGASSATPMNPTMTRTGDPGSYVVDLGAGRIPAYWVFMR